MRGRDSKYQECVDSLKEIFIVKTPSELTALDHFTEQQHQGIEVCIWHHHFSENESHIVFQIQRRIALIFWRNYLSGIVIRNNSRINSMANAQLGNYD